MLGALLVSGCSGQPWNSPYASADAEANVLYESFQERPKHLDPVSAYSTNEAVFVAQVYEPPLQYELLTRPFRLAPLTLTRMPEVIFEDSDGVRLPDDAAPEQVAVSRYRFELKRGILFQPHPAFALDAAGRLRHHALSAAQVAALSSPYDLRGQGTRELVAEDYVYQLKRIAHPQLHSPIFALMSQYIIGLDDLARTLGEQHAGQSYIDLRPYRLAGVEASDPYHFEIRIKGKYPQFPYWLAMPFFSPMAWEVERFYAQPGMAERNLTLDWWPVGTGPYRLIENNPNRRMVLERNPNFRGEPFPSSDDPDYSTPEWRQDAGKQMPFIDRAIYSLEPEAIPNWHKFLQGYYDRAGIPKDSFEQVVQFTPEGDLALSPGLRAQGVSLLTATETANVYTGFNMRDPVVGGTELRAQKLRQAISIAFDTEEFISIFRNGRGVTAHGPVPPGIVGHYSGVDGFNPVTHILIAGEVRRRPVADAERLLAEAGYPGGRDPATGRPLVLHLDSVSGGPESQPVFDWYRKQFARIGIDLIVRQTDYNRFQEKMRGGAAQMFQWGWNADYPDAENFLFLLYGPQAKFEHQGENASNYRNPEFDRLFERMRTLDDGQERRACIAAMVDIVREDAPWIWGFHPVIYGLHHQWYRHALPHPMANNTLKYRVIDPGLRARLRSEWNRPSLWPFMLAGALVTATMLALWHFQRRRPA